MPDVSIYVALITAAAGVLGAAVPQIISLIRDIRQTNRDRRQGERDRQDQHLRERRQACLDLLRAAGDLRTGVANAAQYHGDQMAGRLADIRGGAAAVSLHAVNVALLAPEQLAEQAERVALAARLLARAAEDQTDMQLGQMIGEPDYTEIDESVAVFRQAVIDGDQDQP